jgi:DedD protein
MVGAAVLMAAAIILIPDMLQVPKKETPPAPTSTPQAAPLKTYTIDLHEPAGAAAAVQSKPDERAPPPEQVASEPPTPVARNENAQPRPESSAQTKVQAPPVAAIVKVEPPPVIKQPEVAPQPKPQPASPVVSAPRAPTSGGWVVQVGSFSKAGSAQSIADELQREGHNAFVMPFKSGGGTLYRVRVGPMEKAAAEDALRKIKGAHPKAAVVVHP